jgi:transcriptional regulator with XRE-family HTH domain
MTFGERLRALRKARNLSQRALADLAGVNFTYVSKVESQKLDFGLYPSEGLIVRLADCLGADSEELMLLAGKVPASIRDRIIQRPDVFRALAGLGDAELDDLMRRL